MSLDRIPLLVSLFITAVSAAVITLYHNNSGDKGTCYIECTRSNVNKNRLSFQCNLLIQEQGQKTEKFCRTKESDPITYARYEVFFIFHNMMSSTSAGLSKQYIRQRRLGLFPHLSSQTCPLHIDPVAYSANRPSPSLALFLLDVLFYLGRCLCLAFQAVGFRHIALRLSIDGGQGRPLVRRHALHLDRFPQWALHDFRLDVCYGRRGTFPTCGPARTCSAK